MNNKVVLVTGGFDPLHSGHVEYFKAAKQLGSRLVVGVNSDEWLTRKKGRPFMPFSERASIIKELSCVDEVIGFDDSDDSACHAIFYMLSTHGPETTVVFANGGDRGSANTPEYRMYKNTYGLEFVWAVGGEHKKNSSSWLLDNWKTEKTTRDWGYWRVLDDKQPKQGIKVKELVINPGCSLSYQKHQFRSEHWYILSGKLDMYTEYNGLQKNAILTPNNTYIIGKGVWHKASNIGTEPVHVIEIQYGEKCEEADIERSTLY